VTRTETEPATLAVESWAYETANLPRVLPDGWTHFEMIAAALEAELDGDGVVGVDPDPDGAVGSSTHWYDATVRTDETGEPGEIDHEHVRVASVGSDDGEGDGSDDDAGSGGDADGGDPTQTTLGHDGETTTEEFDVDDALDRL
jgi:hypothetical protein